MLRDWRALSIVVVVVAASVQVQTVRVDGPAGVQQSRVPAAAARPSPPNRALIDRYCISCHSERLRTGGLVLENLDLAQVGSHAEILEKVLPKIRAGQMPPVGRPRPDAAEIRAFTLALEAALDRAAEDSPNPGRPTIHRLNRTEYQNSIRDLLALDVDARALLPADDTDAHGFDNNADVLTVSPALAARYLSAARKVSRLAVGRSIAPTIETYQLPRLLVQDDRLGDRLPFGSRGGAAIEHYFPADGEYGIKIRLQTNNYNYVKGLADQHAIEVRVDRELVKGFTVGGLKDGAAPASYGGTLQSPSSAAVRRGSRVVDTCGIHTGRPWRIFT
jgi:hypothetical protein